MAFKNIFMSMLTTIFGPRTLSKSRAAAVVECAVCLSALDGENGRRVLPCLHEFHSVCIGRWLATPHFKNTCPVCSFVLLTTDLVAVRTAIAIAMIVEAYDASQSLRGALQEHDHDHNGKRGAGDSCWFYCRYW
ncbi:hypothetical protein Salat_1490000 [Sesamum alatum]|uniref:RING-type domain-containing protein n=1 Tax=Sesamum alatum TaxID=300844 RepID=A0AAE1YBG5_9LAMI|nr:hypothetical protein Salat_1490000 [Sesamum alatum]